jgi:hypothetical protein
MSWIKHHTMKTYRGVEVQIHIFLTLALDGGEWSASHFGHFILGERAPGIHWIRGWVGPWPVEKRINLSPLPGTEPWFLSFTLWPIFPWGKRTRYPLDRRLGGPQSLRGRCGEEKNPLPLLGMEPWPFSCLAYSLWQNTANGIKL